MSANRVQISFVCDTLVEADAHLVSAPVVGASVTIAKRTGGGPPTVYEKETGSGATVPTTDSNGRINGWVEEGAYTLTVTGGTPYIAATQYAWDALSGRGIEHSRVGEGSIWRSDLRQDENFNDAQSVLESLVPTGTMFDFGGTVAPAGYLFRDGKSYSTAEYNRLFKVIGYNFGGSGANFNVPNTLGRIIIGAGAGAGLTTRTIGEKGGTETVTLTIAQLASHRHALANESGTPLDIPYIGGGNPTPLGANMNNGNGYDNGFVVTTYIGENEPHTNMSPFLVVPGIIKH
jgi:microcystin-dependent protein